MRPVLLLAAFAAVSCAQSSNPFFDYLPVLWEYLDLSQTQVESIARANEEHDRWVWAKQLRLAEVQREIWQERERTALDAGALGVRMVEVEAICRELAGRVVETRQKLQSLLSEAQRIRLKTLEDALKLVPAIQEAQGVKLLGDPAIIYAGPMFGRVVVSSGGAFSRTDGTRLGAYPREACGVPVFPGNVIRRQPFPVAP